MRVLFAQVRAELALTARRGESLLVAIGLPVALLVFFTLVPVLPTGEAAAVDFLLPGVASIGVMGTAMLGLGIATGYERQYRVLKRLGATPLGRARLIGAKVIAVLLVEAVQVGLLVSVAVALGWSGGLEAVRLIVSVGLGTAAFAGVGLALAGRLRAEANLAIVNAVFLILLLLGGSIIDADRLPAGLADLARLLPALPLSESFRAALDSGGGEGLSRLVAWAVGAPAIAAITFRWE